MEDPVNTNALSVSELLRLARKDVSSRPSSVYGNHSLDFTDDDLKDDDGDDCFCD